MKAVVENTSEVTFDRTRFQIQNAVYFFDDIQKVRIAMGNRVCATYRAGMNLKSGKEMDDKEKDKLMSKVLGEYQRITDYYAETMKSKGRMYTAIERLSDLEFIKSRYDLELIDSYNKVLEEEEAAKKMVANAVKQHPMWDMFFADVKGCGPSIAGKLIAGLDVHKARHVSSFWSYCGVGTRLDENGKRVAMTKKTLVDRTYLDKDGKEQTCKSLGYSPELQSLVCSVFVTSILKTAKNSKYWQCYYEYKNRYENRKDLEGASKLRIHRMASRQVAKALLRDLWVTWRTHEGYEISQPYEVEYLDRAPHKYNEYHVRMGQKLAE